MSRKPPLPGFPSILHAPRVLGPIGGLPSSVPQVLLASEARCTHKYGFLRTGP
ncbi:hypothetical protein BKA81DRAFT_371074 [Phyllosticta paracitricarpa]